MTAQSGTTLQSRIISFYTLLLAGILGATFIVVTLASHRIADSQVLEELEVGKRVFAQLLEQQQQQLLKSATVLTADFGFLEAITIDDPATVLSALINHSRRVDADLMVLFDLDHQVLGHTLSDRSVEFSALQSLFAQTVNYGSVSDVVLLRGHLYQIVLVPVLAPEPVAWIAVGFLVDNALARRLKDITGLEVSFLSRSEVLVSTLPVDEQRALEQALTPIAPQEFNQTTPGQVAGYTTYYYPISVTTGQQTAAILQQSPLAIMAQFTPVQMTLGILSLAALLLTIVGSVLIARRITSPINRLADAADQIQAGQYDVNIDVTSADEIGRLGGSLKHMVEAVADREEKIKRLAFEDLLTGLPNRALFVRELEQLRRLSRRGEMALSVVFLEVDRFKQINETLGYEAGDQVLKYIAAKLPECVRDSDVVSCFGGDEFGILLSMNTPEMINTVTSRIESTFSRPYFVGEQPIDIGFSIGIAHYPDHAQDAESLLRKADVALQKAKRTRIGIAVYDNEQEQSRQEYLYLLGELREAVKSDQLRLYYQPKLRLASNRVIAAEALIRWQHPVRGLVSPDLFIPFAEHTGAIRMVTVWVIESACQTLQMWQGAGITIQVSVNVSTRDLLNPQLPTLIDGELTRRSLNPSSLCLEITESALMEDPAIALNTVTQLAALGVDLAIDDYGTGYSSLAYLKNLPVKELKIDREFIVNMIDKREDHAIVQSTIELGHNLQLSVVAEGVETEAELAELRSLGCDLVQGYHVAKPMPVHEFSAWFSSYNEGSRES